MKHNELKKLVNKEFAKVLCEKVNPFNAIKNIENFVGDKIKNYDFTQNKFSLHIGRNLYSLKTNINKKYKDVMVDYFKAALRIYFKQQDGVYMVKDQISRQVSTTHHKDGYTPYAKQMENMVIARYL